MSGYDGKKNTNPLNLMAKRLGIFYQEPTGTAVDYVNEIKNTRSLMANRLGLIYNGRSVNNEVLDDSTINLDSDTKQAVLEGLDHQTALLEYNGGHSQQERMICDKRRTLDRVVLYSYQAADVKLTTAEDEEKPVRALINPNKVKQDYDDKILSIGYEYGYKPGDVFQWVGTNTYWLIYLQDLTELAYFRGDIRRCSYNISWKDEAGEKHSIFAAVRGPVETKIDTATKNGNQYNYPNYSLSLLIPKTKETLEHFRRYTKFYLKGTDEGAPEVCWRIEAVDWISMPGAMEIAATEYYINNDLDDIEEGLVGFEGTISGIEDEPEENTNPIKGDQFIKAKKVYTYTYDGEKDSRADFIIDQKKYPIEIISKDSNSITIKWNTSYHGQFNLQYGYTYDDIITNDDFSTSIVTKTEVLAQKTIVVESLF